MVRISIKAKYGDVLALSHLVAQRRMIDPLPGSLVFDIDLVPELAGNRVKLFFDQRLAGIEIDTRRHVVELG